MARPPDTLRISGLELECIVGLRPHERKHRQMVRLDLALQLDLSKAGRSARISKTADYSKVADQIVSLLRFREYRLIESATEEVAAMLLTAYPVFEQVFVSLEKPGALRGRARSASVEVTRRRDDFAPEPHAEAFGSLDAILQTPEAGLYSARLDPGATLPLSLLHERGAERAWCWLVAGEARADDQRMLLHQPPLGNGDPEVEVIQNSGSGKAVLICSTMPGLAMPRSAMPR